MQLEASSVALGTVAVPLTGLRGDDAAEMEAAALATGRVPFARARSARPWLRAFLARPLLSRELDAGAVNPSNVDGMTAAECAAMAPSTALSKLLVAGSRK